MPPMHFHSASAMTTSSFTRFNDLPQELRLTIWAFATNIPRIVHLRKKCLRTDKDPDWWMQVRSNKPVDGEDPEFYDNFEIVEEDLERIDRTIACQRLLTPDHKYIGSVTRSEAKTILHLHSQPWSQHKRAWKYSKSTRLFQRVRPVFGFSSDSNIPGVLLACHESHSIAKKFYSLAFTAPGVPGETYFNFYLDTLYLDDLSLRVWNASEVRHQCYLSEILQNLFLQSDLAQVENLAISWDKNLQPFSLNSDGSVREWLHIFQAHFPNLRQFTIAEHRFSHFLEPSIKHGEDAFQGLKFAESHAGWDGRAYTFRLNGYRIDESISRPSHPLPLFDTRRIAPLTTSLNEMYPHERPWQFPTPQFKSLVTETDEAQILKRAYFFEKEYHKGCWYINPQDPADVEDYPWDDLEDNIEELLNI